MTTPPLRVLCVDDNHDAADSMAELFALTGFETRSCFDALTALDIAADFQPDACVLDIDMPGMDGYQLARRIRAVFGEQVMLVAHTGVPWRGPQQEADNVFDHRFAKPGDPATLALLLSRAGGRPVPAARPVDGDPTPAAERALDLVHEAEVVVHAIEERLLETEGQLARARQRLVQRKASVAAV